MKYSLVLFSVLLLGTSCQRSAPNLSPVSQVSTQSNSIQMSTFRSENTNAETGHTLLAIVDDIPVTYFSYRHQSGKIYTVKLENLNEGLTVKYSLSVLENVAYGTGQSYRIVFRDAIYDVRSLQELEKTFKDFQIIDEKDKMYVDRLLEIIGYIKNTSRQTVSSSRTLD